MSYHLITTYYQTSEEARSKENFECLINNISNPLIKKIHLFLQSTEKPDIDPSDKVIFVNHSKRPTFQDFFRYANKLPVSEIKIIANSDIYYNNTLVKAEEALLKTDIIALTRWDRRDDGSLHFYNNPKSQDTWIFQKKVPEYIGQYYIGQHGCDIRLLYELKCNKISYANFSWDIITIHLHQSGLRTYFNNPNYVYVSPPFEFALPEYIEPNLLLILKNNQYKLSRFRFFMKILKNSNYGKNYTILNRLLIIPALFCWYLTLKFIQNEN
jgi:hypothetical protein